MNSVFADSLYWIALTNPEDQWHRKAVAAESSMPDTSLVTTETVLIEFLTYFGARGRSIRRAAARIARALLDRPDVEVIPHTTEWFLEGLTLYEERPDKIDCISMQTMRSRQMTDVLSNDHHFTQEGFNTLL